MDSLELPECPVCLQSFDGESTIPRVLPCGHSACETCLKQLPKPFPDAVRCPACTQLVRYPHPQGPSGLPKNIDLLRFSALITPPNSSDSPAPTKPITQLAHDFIPNLWSYEFYSNWKEWVLPSSAVIVESGEGFHVYGRIGILEEGLLGMPMRCLLKERQKVSLSSLGLFSCGDVSAFRYSYVAKIMWVLFGMRNGQRDELGLILRASLRASSICTVYGFWYNEVDKGVYLVCERYSWSSLEKFKYMLASVPEAEYGVYSFAMIGMEICEAVSGLHAEGFVTGCLSLSCFDINDFGHVYIDFNEVFMMGEGIHRMIAEALSGTRKGDCKEFVMRLEAEILKTEMFISPELLLEMLNRVGIDLGLGDMRSSVGYGSDVWSLACVLLSHLVEKPFLDDMNSYLCSLALSALSATDGKDSDFKGMYMSWLEKVQILLDSGLCLEVLPVKDFLCKCLDFDQGRRPPVSDLWKCIQGLIRKPKVDTLIINDKEIAKNTNKGHCILLGELCLSRNGIGRISDRLTKVALKKEDEDDIVGENSEELIVERDLIEGFSDGHLKCIDLKGHLDCITCLSIGGGYLFSSSFDKTVHVWSLQDFTHVHSFKGHEHKVMAVVFVNEEQPLCITADSGGGICIWSANFPFEEEPIKKLYEPKDWRYSGIHALASSNGYFYTGSGDKSIKAWSMQDYAISCTMTGHKSVVSALAVSNGVLYSGSWDGTTRLWCLSDHSPLTVLSEEIPGNVISGSVLALAADGHTLVAAHENGCIKIWNNDVLVKSTLSHTGAVFAATIGSKWLFTGGWNKTVNAQELSRDESHVDVIQIGSIACDSVVTALIYWEGKLFVGRADKLIKVYHCGP